jgi:hypothetical protein
MKTLLAVVLLTICAFAEGVAGHWQVSLDTPHGAMKGGLEFKQEGSKITGKLNLEGMDAFDLKGTVDGAKIAFDLEMPDNQGTVKFTGTLNGDKITGTTEHGGWTATR